MKKFLMICLFIIIAGILINTVIYMNKKVTAADSEQNKQNIITDETTNTQNDKNIVDDKKDNQKDSENDNIKDYYSINREALKRPIMYPIGNTSQALPQSGIYGADYVYEVKVEGGLTRLLAVFERGNVKKIGPVRSARHNFLDIAMEYDAVFGHFGGSPKAFEQIKSLGISNLNGIILDGTMYWRDKSKSAPNNAYTSIDSTLEYIDRYGYNKKVEDNHFNFSDEDYDIDGSDAKRINIKYSYAHTTSYIYDEANKVYKRYMNGKPHMDSEIDAQLTAKNIIIQFVRYHSIDSEDRQQIDLVGSGMGYFYTNGKKEYVDWKKTSRDSQTKYFDKEGNVIKLNKGQTWIQIVPLTSEVY